MDVDDRGLGAVFGAGDGELASTREGSSAGSSWAKKLCHPLEEIRLRTFKTVLQKLDLGFVSVTDLGLQLEFVKACLKWFNFPTKTLRNEMLNLLLLFSKEESGCQSMVAVGAMPFLTELRMTSTALESQTIDTIMQNIIMKTNLGSDSTRARKHDAETVPYVPTPAKEESTNNDLNDGNNNLSPCPNLELQPPPSTKSVSCGGTPRGILRDVDPLLMQCHLNSVLPSSSPVLPPCDAAALTTAVQALYDATSAVSAAEAILGGEAADVISAATDTMKSILTFVNGVVLKDFPVGYLLTTSEDATRGADVLGALIDSILVWKDKIKRSTAVDVQEVVASLLETLESFVDKLSTSVAEGEDGHFRRQFLVAEVNSKFDDEMLSEDGIEDSSDDPVNDVGRPPNPFRIRSEISGKPAVNPVKVSIASSIIVETLCGFIADILRPLERSFYQTTTSYDSRETGEEISDSSDPLFLHVENPCLLRLSVLAIDILAKSSSLLQLVAPVEMNDADDFIHVFDRCLVALGDAVGRLTWMENPENSNTPRCVSSQPPSRCQLWTYAHLGSILSVLSRGFVECFPSIAESSTTHPLPRRSTDPHDFLPPSSVSSIRLLALDPFFHQLFPDARESAILPIISHVNPRDAGKIVDALDVCAMLTETHFQLKEIREGMSADESTNSLASVVPYLAYTSYFGVVTDVVQTLTRPVSQSSALTHRINTLLQLLAHPIPAVRARVYNSVADVVVQSLQSALEKSVVDNPSHEDLDDALGFLIGVSDDGSSMWRELVLYGLNDSDTSGSVERILTAIIDHRRLIDSKAFLDQIFQRFINPLLPFLVGFAAPTHPFASTVRSVINDFSKCYMDGKPNELSQENESIALKSTLSLLFSREKKWRNEGLRRFLALTDAGKTYLAEASVVEVDIFADAFVRASARTNVSERSGKQSLSTLEDVLRIFTNAFAAADVRSTAARTLANAVVDERFYEIVWGDDRALRTCLAELREADNSGSPPLLSIDDLLPAALQLLEKSVLNYEFRRRRWSSWESSFKSSKGDALSLRELILTLCRLCVKYRKNSAVVESLARLISAFAFSDLEERVGVDIFGAPAFPSGLLKSYNVTQCYTDEARNKITSPNCDLSLLKVHQKLKDDETLILVKHCWNSLESNGDSDDDVQPHLGPLDFSPKEDFAASLMDAEACIDAALRHLEKAACHKDFAVAVSFLAFPALLTNAGGDELENDCMPLLKRFFESPPASPEDESLFCLVLKLLENQLHHRRNSQTTKWFNDLIFSHSFHLFLKDVLSSADASSSSYVVSLLDLLARPPSPSVYSLNVFTICVNWLGSGLDLSHPRILPIVDSAAKVMSRTIAAKSDVAVAEDDPNGVLKEALKILCIHSSNVIRLLLARRSEENQSLVFGSSAVESAAKALFASLRTLSRMTTDSELSELLASTVLSGDNLTPQPKLWFLSALYSPSHFVSSLFWSLLRICCKSSASSSSSVLPLLLRQFPDFHRVCVEASLDLVEVAPIVKTEILHCLLLSCHALGPLPDEGKRSLTQLFKRYDLIENVVSSLDPSSVKSGGVEHTNAMNVLKLRLLKWFVVEESVGGERERASALGSFLVRVFSDTSGQPLQIDDEEREEDDIVNWPNNSLCVNTLGALLDVLLSLVSQAIQSDANDKSFFDCFFSLDFSFFNRCLALFSTSFLSSADTLWRPSIQLMSLLLADSSFPNVYLVAIAMLKHKEEVLNLLVVSSSLPPPSLTSATLASLYRFFAFLLTRISRDSDCLEVLDGLFDIPHRVDSDETHGSLLASTIYQRFLYHIGDGRANSSKNDNDDVDVFSSQRLPPSTIEMAAVSLLKQLVAVSSTAKTTALFDLGLVERLVGHSLNLETALSLDSLNGAHNPDGSIPSFDGVLQRLAIHLSLLTNLLSESEEAKSVAASVDGNIGLLFHRLWSWVPIDESLAEAFFQCVGAFAADNPIGIANCLCSNQRTMNESTNHSASRLSSSSAAGKISPVSLSVNSTSSIPNVQSSLLHSLGQYVSKLRHYPHQCLMLGRCFILLGKCASISPEVRGVLTKTQFLEKGFCQLNPKHAVTSSLFPIHSAWLDFVCNLTMDTDGQLMIFKADGAIDLLLEYLSTPNAAVATTTPSPSLSSLRQKSALALHNLSYSPKNVTLFARQTFLPTLIRRATVLAETQSTPQQPADQKTSLICCAALWSLATRLKKNASLIKGSNCRAKLQEAIYKLSRRDDVEEEEDKKNHLTYCKKIVSVLDS